MKSYVARVLAHEEYDEYAVLNCCQFLLTNFLSLHCFKEEEREYDNENDLNIFFWNSQNCQILLQNLL